MAQDQGTPCWKFGNAQLDERTLELSVAGRVVEVERKPLEVLRFLLLHAGELVTHEQILEAVWPRRILSESVLTKVVSRLREVLQDEEHRIVKTVHGYGYRLLPPVELESPRSVVVMAPDFELHARLESRQCAVLILDIAGAGRLRAEQGDTAAGQRSRALLERLVALARRHHGEFIKSYGDDLMAVFEKEPLLNAAGAAIEAQREAREAGLQLYSAFHGGTVEFRQTLGYPDATGLTIDIAMRLRQLTEGAPGRIFLAEEAVAALPMELRGRCRRYGMRELKGLGECSVWTLDWHDEAATAATEFRGEDPAPPANPGLSLLHQATVLRLAAADRSCLVGRGGDCALRVADPERRVSASHLLLEFSSGRWFVQDISRNGTWLRDGGNGAEVRLPGGRPTLLPRSGLLCLGGPLSNDPEGRYIVQFGLIED